MYLESVEFQVDRCIFKILTYLLFKFLKPTYFLITDWINTNYLIPTSQVVGCWFKDLECWLKTPVGIKHLKIAKPFSNICLCKSNFPFNRSACACELKTWKSMLTILLWQKMWGNSSFFIYKLNVPSYMDHGMS